MKRLTFLLVVLLALCLAACQTPPPTQPDPDTPPVTQGDDALIRTVYEAYAQYAAAKGDEVLTYEAWLETVKGEAGEDGLTPTIGHNGNWWIGNHDTGVPAQGKDGVSIVSVEKVGTVDLVDTYAIHYSDKTVTTFTVTNGKDGLNGNEGVGITNVLFNSDKELEIVLSDGRTLNLGALIAPKGDKGEQGAAGLGVKAIAINQQGELVFTMSDDSLINCGKQPVCAHTYGEETVIYAPTCTSIGVSTETCEKCAYEHHVYYEALGHQYGETYGKAATCTVDGLEFQDCSICGDTKVKYIPMIAHSFVNSVCSVCGAIEVNQEQTPNYPWEKTDLFFQMSNNSNKNELPSGCERYLVGKGAYSQRVDVLIDERNAMAELETKTHITYDFWPESETEHTWSQDIVPIMDKTLVPGLTSTPDMYCTFVYDMVGAMLQGCFANALTDVRGENYFRFTKDDYDPTVDDEGYMYEYMTSLTLSSSSSRRMYLVASDYFMDLVRAFYVVPVNLKLLVEYAGSVTSTYDPQGSDYADFDALVRIVQAGGWNYELLMAYCEAVKMENTETMKYDLGGRVGFALAGSSASSAAGMLYTQNITIINRTGNDLTDYVYSYPETNADLTQFAVNLKSLMETDGVYVRSGQSGKDLDEIRAAFATNHVLFGGVICVGSLEDEVYQYMREEHGFGVLPVPLYRTVNPETCRPDPYNTQIHNVGRIGAIAKNTTKFSQCTAFLNYQSTHSTDILNEYYDRTLTKDAAGESDPMAANVGMMQFMRANVGSAFDKIFEEAVGLFGDMQGDLWHKIIQSGTSGAIRTEPYCIGENMTAIYELLYRTKSAVLHYLEQIFESYADE